MFKAQRTLDQVKQLQREMHDFSLAFLLGQEIGLFPENEIAKAKAQAMHDASHLLDDVLKGEATARLKKTMVKEVEEGAKEEVKEDDES